MTVLRKSARFFTLKIRPEREISNDMKRKSAIVEIVIAGFSTTVEEKESTTKDMIV
jgi:hypothetical protein